MDQRFKIRIFFQRASIMERFRTSFVILFLAALFVTAAHSQSFQAQLTGNVKDSSGASVPNAKLTATNVANGTQFTAESNDQGIYRFLALPPAQYKVATTVSGFKSFEQGH